MLRPMKKLFFALAAIVLSAYVAMAQALSAEQILDRCTKAMGNKEYASLNNFEIEAEMTINGLGMQIKMFIERDGRFRQEAFINNKKLVQLFDGTQGWQALDTAAFTPLSEKEVADIAANMANTASPALQNLIDGADSVSLSGTQSANDKTYDVIKVVNNMLDVEALIYIDKVTYLPNIIEMTVMSLQQKLRMTMDDFQKIEGSKNALSPVSTVISTQGQVVNQVTITSIKAVSGFPAGTFSKE